MIKLILYTLLVNFFYIPFDRMLKRLRSREKEIIQILIVEMLTVGVTILTMLEVGFFLSKKIKKGEKSRFPCTFVK